MNGPRSARVTPPSAALTREGLEGLRARLQRLRAEAFAGEERHRDLLDAVHPQNRLSARNLIHYLVLRRVDMRALQSDLAWLGLSSLGRSEAHVLVSLDRILGMLTLALGEALPSYDEAAPVGFRQGDELVREHAEQLLGPAGSKRSVRIVVTIPTDVADDASLAADLVEAGMDVARINCAHDDPTVWTAMIERLRTAAEAAGRSIRILMDLSGPKLRLDDVGADGVARVRQGDRLLLVPTGQQAAPDVRDGELVVTCPVDEVLRDARTGDPVWFDDGTVGGVIEEAAPSGLRIRVTHAPPRGKKLRGGKGINLPETVLDVPGLRDDDLDALSFAAEHADAVALSFVQSEDDIARLQSELETRGRPDLGVVLKIETRVGFANLPRLLLAAMRSPRYGVMIARGDLAVETGFERLAEVQEEILWVAQAAHAPTIWATQVLESLAKRGTRSRAEVTDAAMSGRAEAVMLNKGEFVLDAIRSLDDILSRMSRQHDKKRALLRPLGMSEMF